jgi:hypothetical protein
MGCHDMLYPLGALSCGLEDLWALKNSFTEQEIFAPYDSRCLTPGSNLLA